MKSKRQTFCWLLEKFINEGKKDVLETHYGKNTTVKIPNINFGITSKSLIVECVIVLGDMINEDVIERKYIDYLVNSACDYFFGGYSVKVMIRWDV